MTDHTRFPTGIPEIHRPYAAADDRYDLTEYRQVGSSGLFLPPISLGLWWNFGDNIPFDRQRTVLRNAFDSGITHFDLANNYGPPYGTAETNFGRLFKDDFRRPFHQQPRLAIGSLVERRHEPVFRFERDSVDAAIRRLLDLPRHPQLVCKRVERAFGRIALHLPGTLLLEQLRIVAEQRDAPHHLEYGVRTSRLPVFPDVALG